MYVTVYTDMSHLVWTPSEIPSEISNIILQDIHTYYEGSGSTMVRLHELKPHVHHIKHLSWSGYQWTIDYTKIASGSRLTGEKIKGTHELYVLHNLLTTAECIELINKANTLETMHTHHHGSNRSWHQPGTGGKYSRAIMIDQQFADELWLRIKHYLPETMHGYRLLYLNSHFRFSRYRKGGMFHTHCDGKNYDTSRPDVAPQTESLLTLNIFLNSEGDPLFDLEGGGTTFYEGTASSLSERITVPAKAGTGALFWAEQYHRGDEVLEGYKYLLRTDVMGVSV
jgi:hypothetical protein